MVLFSKVVNADNKDVPMITHNQRNISTLMIEVPSNYLIEADDLPAKYLDPADHKVSVNALNFVASPRVNIPEDGIDLNKIVRGLEEDLIMQALDKTNWNKNRAAKLLKLNRTTLVEKLRKKGLIKPRTEQVSE